MKLEQDKYASLDSPLHRWEPRCKFVGLVALIFAFSFVRELSMLPAMMTVTAAIYAISRLPVSFWLTRLRYPSFFLLVVVLLLPFLSGQTVILSLGPLGLRQEGLISVMLITVRFLCILTVGLVLFGTAPFLTTIKAMRALGLPGILTDMALLAFRYLNELGDDLHRMETSMRLRGFRQHRLSRRGLGVLAWLGGSILVRSYERSEWVYRAMIVRGYGNAPPPRDEFQVSAGDVVALVVTFLVAIGFVAGDILI
ncbi:MAG TPA: cobalt ECF transporter T component CbiQ [Dehalococcoidia bacterium]|nr:cobalt ECF transporter T component CbiQ [Dehalococcoidia bacterium]